MYDDPDVHGISLESPTKARLQHGQYPCNGNYFTPKGKWPKTAFIAGHYTASFANHYLAEYLARLGYGFLGWDTRFARSPVAAGFNLEHALVDLGVGMRWLREVARVENIVILGNSGGASLMGAYQAQALHPHIDPGAVPSAELENLPAADFYISLAAHPGRAQVFTEWLDPSVTDENDPLSCDPDLDMYNPANGPPYPADFVERYRAAQVARNDRITVWAAEELRRIGEGRPQSGERLTGSGAYGVAARDGVFDRFFSAPRQFADLRFLDLSIDPSKRVAGCYMGDPHQSNYSGYGLAPVTSVREWMAMWSLSQTQVNIAGQLPHITQPSLVISANHDLGVFPSHASAIYEALGSSDKRLMTVDGGHYFEESGSRDALAHLIGSWLADRGVTLG